VARGRYNAPCMETIKIKTVVEGAVKAQPGRALIITAVALLALVGGGVAFAWKYDLQKIRTRVTGRPASASTAVASVDPDAPVPLDDASPTPPQQRVLLLEDPVCKQPVDPKKAQFVLEFGNHSIYFDSLECLQQYRDNPTKFARVRVKVTLSDAAQAKGPLDDSTPLDDKAGGPPEPPLPEPSADPLNNTEPLALPPASAPEPGVEPKSQPVHDAPSVQESNPPSDVPAKLPSDVPNLGPEVPRKPAAAAKKKPAPAPTTDTDLPPTVEPGTPDTNGFSLPPDMGSGPPPRKKPGAKPSTSADGAPSTEEAPPAP